jgi:uncharacterized membrane protein YkoI
MKAIIIGVSVALICLGSAGKALSDDHDGGHAPKLSPQEVGRIVLEEFPGATIKEIELETEDGRLVYEVELVTVDGYERELHVDAATGKIITMKRD